MRRFANLYIVLFLLDAGLSLIDELLLALASPWPALSGVRILVAYLVVALSFLIYPLLGIDRRLPKRIFLPLTLYAFWGALALWPLQGMIPRESFVLMISFGQAFIGGVALITLRSFYQETLLPKEHFEQPLFAWRNTFIFSAVNLLLLPFLLTYVFLAMAGIYLDQSTAGFMRLSPVGLYATARTYHHGAKSVRLAAMMHVGRAEYYQELVDSLPATKTIILAEGVTDQDGLLKHQFNYGNLAKLAGLSSQETMQLKGNLIKLADLDAPDPDKENPALPDIVRADIDINRFNPATIEFLNLLGRTLLSQKPRGEALTEYLDWAKANKNPQWFSEVMADILERRNQVAIDSFLRSLKSYDIIVIPWGAMHMPAIEAAVLKQNFVPWSEHERLVIDFRKLPYASWWKKFLLPAEMKNEPAKSES